MKSKVNQKLVLSALSLAVILAVAEKSQADTLGTWTINGTTTSGDGAGGLAPAATAANLTATNLLLGAGPAASGTANTFGANNWIFTNSTEANAIAANDYVTFSFTAATGYAESFSTIDAYNIRRSATGPSTGIWEYEVGAGPFVDIGSAITWGGITTSAGNPQTALNLSGLSDLQNVSAGVTVTFRLVNWGATGATGTWYLNGQAASNNLVIEGSVAVASSGGTPSSLLWTGGNAAWDQATSQWENLSPNDTVWSNTVNGPATSARFNTANTIGVDAAGVTTNGLNFQNGSDGIVLNGPGALTLNSPGIIVATSNTATINTQISGSAGLSLTGGGKLVLTSTANNFTGAVTLSGGKLSVTDDRQLGDPANTITLSGGTLQTTASITTARSFTGGGTLDIAPATTYASTGTFNTTSVTLANTGTLDLQGSSPTVGTLIFTGAGSTLTSTTGQAINASGITASNLTGNAVIASAAGGFVLAGTATVTVQVGPSTGASSADLNIQTALTLGGSANSSLKKTGTGTLELNGDNENLWRIQIGSESASSTTAGGTVIINNSQSLGNNQLFLNSGTLQASTDLTNQTANGGSDNSIGIGVSIGGLDNGPAVFAGSNIEFQGSSDLFEAAANMHVTVNNTTILDGALTLSGSGATGLTIDGSGKLTINGDASAMTLATKVSGTATLEVNGNWGAATTVNAGARLQGHGAINAAVTIASGGTIAPGSSTTTLTINNSLALAAGSNSAFVIDAPASAGLGNSSNITGLTTLTYGGNLAITLGTGSLITGDSWKLFTFTAGQTGSFDNNSVFGTNGTGSLLPDLSLLDSSDPNAKWFFDYSTGTLSIADSGATGTPTTLLWTGGNATWDQVSSVWQNTNPNDTTWSNATNGTATVAAFNSGNTIAVDAAGVAANGLNFQAGSNGILLNGTGALTLNGSIVSVDPSVTATIAAKISGSVGLSLLGGGNLILSSTASDFTGTVSINAGKLSISDDRNLGNSSNPIALNSGTLQTTASLTSARNISGTGTLDIAPSTTYATTGSFNTTSLALTNTGTLDLQGSSPNVGALTLTVASTLTSSTGQQITAAGITATNLVGTATISSTGGLNLGTSTSSINVGTTGTLIIQAPITGAQLTNSGKGTLDLFGNNANMTRVSMSSGSGIININNANTLGNSQLFFNGGTLNATTDLTSTTGNAMPIGISIGTDSTTGSAAATLTGSNMEFTGATGLFEEPNEFTHVSVQNTTTLSGTFTSDSPSFAGIGFMVDGGGTLVINGDASGMLRNTIVNGATSLITNSTFGGSITLNGGTLGGHGTIAAAVIAGTAPHTIAPSATLAPGSINTLSVASLTTNNNTTLQFNLVTPLKTATNGSDLINVTNPAGLTLGDNTTISVNVSHTTGGPSTLGYYQIMQYTGTLNGNLNNITLPAAEDAGNVVYTLSTTQSPGFVDIHRGYLGDVDDSGFVDINDLAVLAANWQQPGGWSQGNFLNDTTVDINDLAVLAAHWQTGIAAFGQAADSIDGTSESFQDAVSSIVFGGVTQVPEPASLALLGLAALPLLKKRSRNRVK